jgi:hypothetical protein
MMDDYHQAQFAECREKEEMEAALGNGQKRQLTIPMRVLQHLPFLSRLQRLFMMPESVKQMTWHKNDPRYNPGKMIYPSDAEAWKYFDL